MTSLSRVRLAAVTLLTFLAGAASTRAADLPPAADRKVDFKREVLPLLAHRCFECHGNGKKKGAFDLSSREGLLKGGEVGPALVAGKSAESALIKRVAGIVNEEDEIMPPKGDRLTAKEIGILRAWVDQGAVWDAPAIAAKKIPPVAPRKVDVPAGEGNPIDRLLADYAKKNNIDVTKSVDDAVYARRVYLDIVGLLPTPAQLDEFKKDARADKREQLVASLLSQNEAYADHWITFWQDHLRDGKKDLGSTDIFRPITSWLRASLAENQPYDKFVTELIDPPNFQDAFDERARNGIESVSDGGNGGSDGGGDAEGPKKEMAAEHKEPKEVKETKDPKDPKEKPAAKPKPKKVAGSISTDGAAGFVLGLQGGLEKPRGDQMWEVQAVQNIGQIFLGVQLKCATCHDSFVDRWTMKDAWGLASIYSDKPLEMVRCEVPTGKHAEPRFVFPELGTVDATASAPVRRARLAELVTTPQNGRFTRTITNRIWARLMGRGIVDSLDDLDHEPWNADVLDWLANDLVEHKYDLKRTIAIILTSKAYQLPSVEFSADAGPYVFKGPQRRRLTAEQFVDAVASLSGRTDRVWKQNGNNLLEKLGRPDRRVVTTQRDNAASPLQAMEFLNGTDVHALVYGEPSKPAAKPKAPAKDPAKPAAKDPAAAKDKPAAKPPADGETDEPKIKGDHSDKPAPGPATQKTTIDKTYAGLDAKAAVERLYLHALARTPTEKEAAICAQIMAAPTKDGAPSALGDLLWAVVMLPEFQLIR